MADHYDATNALEALLATMECSDSEAVASDANRNARPPAAHHREVLVDALNRRPAETVNRLDALRVFHPVAPSLIRSADQMQEPDLLVDVDSAATDELNQVLTREMLTRRLNGQECSAAEIAERLEERLIEAQEPTERREAGLLPQLWVQIGLTHLLGGSPTRAITSLARARRLASLEAGSHVERESAGKAAVAHALRGAVEQAARDLASARVLLPAPKVVSDVVDTTERVADAFIQLETMGAELSEHIEGLDSVSVADELWPLVALIRGRYELARSRPSDALDVVSMAFELHPSWERGSLADDIRISLTADAFIALGEIGAASAICEEAMPQMSLSRLSRVRVDLHTGNLAAAARECRALSGARSVAPAVRVEALLLLAWIGMEKEGCIDTSVGHVIAPLLTSDPYRRLLTTIPRAVVEAIAAHGVDRHEPDPLVSLRGITFAAPRHGRLKLTPAERKILVALDDWHTTSQIASALFLSPNTVKNQLASIYRKLNVNDRASAKAVAARLNLISEPRAESVE